MNTTKLAYTFKSDVLFKMLFSKNQKLLKRLVSVILKIKITSITSFNVINSEIAPEEIDTKFCKIDIRMKINDELVSLEIQALNRGNYPERTLYYWAREFSSSLPAGKDYDTLPKVIVINIVDFVLFKGLDVCSKFMPLEVSTYEELTDKMVLYYFELPKLKNFSKSDELSLWLALFDANTEEDLEKLLKLEVDFVNEAVEEYRNITADEKFREIQRKREMQINDEANALSYARKLEREKWLVIVAEKDEALLKKEAEKKEALLKKDREIELLLEKIKQLQNNKE